MAMTSESTAGEVADAAAIALAILRYRHRTSKLGNYSSLFDMALMSHAYNISVVLHVEERAINIVDEYLPSLKERRRDGAMHMIWCKWDNKYM